tara:strand:- start:539 stop:799 length:261 start_codon:yes stop_codon:yes gene_type:complete
MKIYKYEFEVVDELTIAMPRGARVLSVDVQRGAPCMWALVDPDELPLNRKFAVYGTGHPMDQVGEFVGTFQMAGGLLVFHLFEVEC